MGKVYRKGGEYLVRREIHIHTGIDTRFEWVDDVNDATVFYGNHGTGWRKLKEAALQRVTRRPCCVGGGGGITND